MVQGIASSSMQAIKSSSVLDFFNQFKSRDFNSLTNDDIENINAEFMKEFDKYLNATMFKPNSAEEFRLTNRSFERSTIHHLKQLEN